MSTPRRALLHEATTASIIGAFYELYNQLGFGFLESVYSAGMAKLLRARGHKVEREALVKVFLYGEELGHFRVDLLVDDRVAVENKSTYHLSKEAPRQLYNELKASPLEVGLLLHFGPRAKFYRLAAADLQQEAYESNP